MRLLAILRFGDSRLQWNGGYIGEVTTRAGLLQADSERDTVYNGCWEP